MEPRRLHAAPEEAFHLQEHGLIERVGLDLDQDPLGAAGQDRQIGPRVPLTSMLCWSWAMCLSAAPSSEND